MQRGFSLMELMVVIAIIAILVGIAIPSYSAYTKRAHFTQAIQSIAPYKIAVALCFQQTGQLESCSAGHHHIPKDKQYPSNQLVHSIHVASGGIITLTPNNIKGFSSEDRYILTPLIKHQTLFWNSSGLAVDKNYAK